MIAGYDKGTIDLRDLGADDVTGICHCIRPRAARAPAAVSLATAFPSCAPPSNRRITLSLANRLASRAAAASPVAPRVNGKAAQGDLFLLGLALFCRGKSGRRSTRGGDSA